MSQSQNQDEAQIQLVAGVLNLIGNVVLAAAVNNLAASIREANQTRALAMSDATPPPDSKLVRTTWREDPISSFRPPDLRFPPKVKR